MGDKTINEYRERKRELCENFINEIKKFQDEFEVTVLEIDMSMFVERGNNYVISVINGMDIKTNIDKLE